MKPETINHRNAWGYFVSIGAIPPDATNVDWVLHHKDPSLRKNDPERYKQWRIEDLQPMTRADHTQLHWTFKEEARLRRQKISEA